MTLQEKLLKKYPGATVSGGLVTTDTESLLYRLDAIGRLRLYCRRWLTPVEIRINKQPVDHVIKLVGEGPYYGHYYVGHNGEGYLATTTDISTAHRMREYMAKEQIEVLFFDARACYGGKFITEKI